MEIFLANIIKGIATVFKYILNIYLYIIVISALITWVSPDPRNPIVSILRSITEPILNKLRRISPFPLQIGFIDITPIVLILIVLLLQYVLVNNLFYIAYLLYI